MKIKHKKVAASGIAVALAGVLGVGALLQTSVSVQASSAMMPGIEEIVSEASADKPFKILEIVDNTQDAEIGYYVSGQEPYIKLYSYTYKYKDENNTEQEETIHFQTLEEGLEKLPSDTLRKEFAQNVKIDDGNISGEGTGIKNIQSICYQDGSTGDAGDYPLSYSPYVEQYLISSDEEKSGNWTRIDFKDAKTDKSRTDTVKINGEYREKSAGTGDYTKQEQTYYPIREGSDDKSQTDKYRENIQNFYYADGGEANAPYFLEFEEVDNATVNVAFDANHNKINGNSILAEYNYEDGEYGYYENVYSDLTQEIVENITDGKYTFPGEKPETNLDSAVRIPNTTNTTSVNARTFSDGTGDFSSINEQSSTDTENNNTDQVNISADNSQTADAFSSGDFSDGVSADGDIGNNDTVQTQDVSDTGTDSEFDAGANQNATTDPAQTDAVQATAIIENDKIEPIIAYTQKTDGNVTAIDDSVGKSENPKVYYGRTINQYPYYQYTLISDMRKVVTCATENQEAVDNGTFTPAAETDPEKRITFQDNQYWYWTVEANGTVERNPISVVTQRQPVSYDDIREIPQGLGYNYYYKVKQAYFCCKKGTETDNDHTYAYYGWYSPSYSDQNNVYIKVSDGDGKVATHYISEAEYKLTPGIGNYDFAPDETKDQESVEVNHMYYQGGYKNNNWFKGYVFHLTEDNEKDKEQFDKFNIEVDTITSQIFNETYGNAAVKNINTEDENTLDAAAIDNQEESSEEVTVPDTEAEETSEITPMVSEAGVELVSIENEVSANGDSEFQEGADAVNDVNETDMQQTENIPNAEFSDGESNGTEIFSAGEAEEYTDGSKDLSDYDLVYINGNNLNAKSFKMLADMALEKKFPCIINQVKLAENADLKNAFAEFINTEDEDNHYVTKSVYFFKNNFEGQNNSALLSTAFHTNFNPDSESDISDGTQGETKGFEEILEYITSENKYRQLGNSDSDNITDGSQQTPTPISSEELLDMELSHARAIEYIINYRLKRVQNTKDKINVLELQPAKSDGQLSDIDILKLLGYDDIEEAQIVKVESCCGKDTIQNVLNNDTSKVWESTNNIHQHWVKLTFAKSIEVEGFTYTPIQSGKNGILYMSNVKLYAEDGSLLKTEGDNHYRDDYANPDRGCKSVLLESPVKDVKSMEIIFKGTYGETVGDKYASAAQIGVIEKINGPVEIEKKIMTASEFVGHIDDINSEYDMIYIGDDSTHRNKWINGDSESMLYTHVGGMTRASEGYWKLIGQMTNDFNSDRTVNTNSSTTSFRGSGNDITKQQYKELLNFANSGYPVIIANGLLSGDSIDTSKIDKSSYWYKYLKKVLSYDNVMSFSDSQKQKNDIIFYLNVAKPEISFSENGMPYEAPRGNKAQGEEIKDGDTVISTYNYITGKLEYKFTIKNDAAVSAVNTQYDCKLYLDLNFDGNLSNLEEQSSYIEIKDANGVVQTRSEDSDGKLQYHLKAGEEYTLTRIIPSDYYKLIAWKLEILNVSNSSIRTSVNGYSKQKNNTGTRIPINVLQIVPDSTCAVNSDGRANGTWDLSDRDQTSFQSKISQIEDFDIKVEKVTINDFKDDPNGYLYGKQDGQNTISSEEKQIVIIGFDDVYQNIPMDSVKAILGFIEKGRSVIFSHDTTSHYNYLYDENNNTANGAELWTNWIVNTKGKANWGVSMNQVLREIVGMDRYGITDNSLIDKTSISVSDLLKQGNELTEGEKLPDWESVNFETLMKLAGDVAYVTNSNGTKSYMQTQGYSNSQLERQDDSVMVYRATKVNDGAITQYPYVMKDEIQIAGTHSQYYQLALEQDDNNDNKNDIVVWYCLAGADKYTHSPNDVRNYYYFYSKGNVIYTGAGHSAVKDSDEIELFINAIVAAANVAAVKPEVNFIKSLDPGAGTESVRYYVTDQSKWTEEDDNLLDDNVELYFNVKDYNMVSSSLSDEEKTQKEMIAEIYIEDETSGEIITPNENEILPDGISGKKLKDINIQIGQLIPYGKEKEPVILSSDQKFHLENNAYKFKVSSLKNFLENKDGSYKEKCKVYIRIKSTVSLYGRKVMNYSWATLDLKRRQLFDLD